MYYYRGCTLLSNVGIPLPPSNIWPKVIGGGIVIAAAIVAIAWALTPAEREVDLDRDVCASFNYDKLDIGDVDEAIQFVLRVEPDTSALENEFFEELERLVATHNGSRESSRYRLVARASYPIFEPLRSYRGLASGGLCRDDFEICRNRNFWFFRELSPSQLAQVVFEGSIKKEPSFKKCSFGKWASSADRPLDPDLKRMLDEALQSVPSERRNAFSKLVHDELRTVVGHLTASDLREAIDTAAKQTTGR